MSPEKYFTEEQKDMMVAAIKEAEKNTSGEIRIHIENQCPKEVLDRAADVFANLKMQKTALGIECGIAKRKASTLLYIEPHLFINLYAIF